MSTGIGPGLKNVQLVASDGRKGLLPRQIDDDEASLWIYSTFVKPRWCFSGLISNLIGLMAGTTISSCRFRTRFGLRVTDQESQLQLPFLQPAQPCVPPQMHSKRHHRVTDSILPPGNHHPSSTSSEQRPTIAHLSINHDKVAPTSIADRIRRPTFPEADRALHLKRHDERRSSFVDPERQRPQE